MKKILLIFAAILMLAAACKPVPPSPKYEKINNEAVKTNLNSSLDNSAKQSEVYKNTDFKVILNYSGLLVQPEIVSSYIPPQSYLKNPVSLVTLYVKPPVYAGTNLEAAWFYLTASPETIKEICYEYTNTDGTNIYGVYKLDKVRKAMGNEWHYSDPHPVGGAAAGHSSQGELYRLYKNGQCYEVELATSEYNRQNLPNPNSVKDYNSKQIFNILGALFNRLEVK